MKKMKMMNKGGMEEPDEGDDLDDVGKRQFKQYLKLRTWIIH